MNLTPGQKLWCVPSERRGKPHEVTVATVGRKWFTVINHTGHWDIETGHEDGRGYSSPSRCYESREQYETKVVADMLWLKLIRKLEERPRRTVTTENIRAAAKLLGLTLPEVTL